MSLPVGLHRHERRVEDSNPLACYRSQFSRLLPDHLGIPSNYKEFWKSKWQGFEPYMKQFACASVRLLPLVQLDPTVCPQDSPPLSNGDAVSTLSTTLARRRVS